MWSIAIGIVQLQRVGLIHLKSMFKCSPNDSANLYICTRFWRTQSKRWSYFFLFCKSKLVKSKVRVLTKVKYKSFSLRNLACIFKAWSCQRRTTIINHFSLPLQVKTDCDIHTMQVADFRFQKFSTACWHLVCCIRRWSWVNIQYCSCLKVSARLDRLTSTSRKCVGCTTPIRGTTPHILMLIWPCIIWALCFDKEASWKKISWASWQLNEIQ